MKNQDLQLAKLKLIEDGLSLVAVKRSKVIFETKRHSIVGFLQAIERLDRELVGVSIADKIVGVAAAMLCVYAEASSVFALTISDEGIRVLEENNIEYMFENKVQNILNRNKTDTCPFEKTAITCEDSEEAYIKLKSLANHMVKKAKEIGC